ncbi:Uncharacterised protein [Mycobacteroides abscessus]|nr:Uncharacterised protein [Mycobacteroides abscessus]
MTHSHAASCFFDDALIESATPLKSEARSPVGPTGPGAIPTSTPSSALKVPVAHEPLVPMATLPEPTWVSVSSENTPAAGA